MLLTIANDRAGPVDSAETGAADRHATDPNAGTRPDLALLDLQMPEPDGIQVARRLPTELPDCRCIIVTSHGRPGYLKSALAAGVRGGSSRRLFPPAPSRRS